MPAAELISAIMAIIAINLVLSGDNAVVIGMAAHALPARQRKWAIGFGAAAAVALRVVLTAAATLLLLVPALKVVGGLLLLWIAFKLLKPTEAHSTVAAADSLRAAIWTILVADFVMSLDNVLAIAAVARGNIPLLMAGLIMSMPIVMFLGGLIAGLLDRLWWLAYLGSGLIAWTGVEMALADELLTGFLHHFELLHQVLPAVLTVVVLGLAHWYYRSPARRSSRPAVAVTPDG